LPYIIRVKLNKKNIITNLVIVPKTQKRPFWAREMKMLNNLLSEFNNDSFWETLSFQTKYDSLAFFISEYGKKILKKRFNEYNYKVPNKPKPKMGDKVGEDKSFNEPPLTIRQFLK